VILPLEPAAFADMGLELLVDTKEAMQALIGHPIEMLGAVVTQWRDDALNRQLLAAATKGLNDANIRVFDTKVPLDKTNIERAYIETGQGKRRQLLDRTCPSAKAYKALVEEVL
jgi:hypothetical protein